MSTTNKYITLAYKLYTTMADGTRELMEEATTQHPFMFISGMGLTLDAFEAQILSLGKGDAFDFTLSVDEAYGPYVEEGVLVNSGEFTGMVGGKHSEGEDAVVAKLDVEL
mgnify:CR=1 FL=1